MVKIIVDLDKETNKKVELCKIEQELKTKEQAIIYLIKKAK